MAITSRIPLDTVKPPKRAPPPPVSLWQLFRYADATDRLFVVLGAVIATITGFSWNLLTIAFGDVVDVFVEYEMALRSNATTNETTSVFMADVYYFSGGLLALWIANSVCNYLILVLFPLAAINQIKTIKVKYFASVLKQDMSWFDTTSSGDFASRVTADLKRIEDGLNEKMGLAIYNAATAIIAIATAFFYGWKLTLIIISLLPFLAFGTSVMNKVQATFARKEVEAYAAAGTVAEEVISAIRTVLAFGGQRKEVDRYCRHLRPALKSGIRRNFMTGVGNGLMFACLYFGLALGIWFGVQMIIESRESGSHDYTIGTIVIVFWCVSGAGFSIGGAAPHFEAISVAKGTAAKVFAIIERKPEIDVSAETGVRPEVVSADIELKDVHFCYPTRPDVKVLNGFSLRIRSGESVALVGPSGCGKSTVIQLIERFYDPNSGSVCVDGHDLKTWNLGFLRQQIGAVGQEPVLFDTSIWQNIALGSHHKYVDQKDIETAATEANAHEFVAKLPKKYETYVGDRGAQLSGGQKQRIAIARALINRPKILLLDEATSALDLQSEAVVQTALERAAKGRTTVVVAHRLSTIVNCDRIVFISDGRVREEGSHSELMAKKGLYFGLVLRQQITERQTIEVAPEDNAPEDTRSQTAEVAEEDEDEAMAADEEVALKKFSQRRLLRVLAADKYCISLGLFLSLMYGLVVPIYAFIFGAFVEVFATTSDARDIWLKSYVFTFYYIGIAVSVGLISVAQMTALGVAGERLTMRLRTMAFEAITRQEVAWFDRSDNSSGALCARLSADAANVQGASGSRMAIICQAAATFLTSAVLGFWLNWQLSAVAAAFIPFILIGSAVSASVDNWELKSNKQSMERSTKVAIEAIAAIRTVAALHREKHFCDQFVDIVQTNAKTSKKKSVLRAFTLSFALSVVFLSYAVVFLYGGILLARGQLQSGAFFIIIETLIYGSMTVGQSSVFTSDYRKAKIAAANIFRLVDRKSPVRNGSERPDSCNGDVSFRSVHFQYPNRPEAKILRGLSVDVRRGQTVALVGASGCGKSTAVQLLEKFYDVTKGSIQLDGRNVDSLDTDWLRRQMALVSQEPVLFSYSIGDNIAYGDNTRHVSMEEVVRAAERANIHHFIRELPMAYDTPVGAKGAQLSGGQKQRIAIARALVREPQILLLDEATSALDTASEQVVQDALDTAAEGRTALVIAHRLSTIRNAEKIVVMDRGCVVEVGTHEELMSLRGVYHDLYSLNCF